MCFSAESSITAFIIGISASIILLMSKDKSNKCIGLFFISINLMQLLEFFIWTDQTCGIINNIASRLILPVLLLQIITGALGLYLFDTTFLPKNLIKMIIIMTFFVLIINIYICFNNNLEWCTKPNENNSLQWANLEYILSNYKINLQGYPYYVILILITIFFKPLWKGILISMFGLTTYILTRYPNWDTSNSRWCFFSAFLPVFFIIVERIYK